MRATVAAVLAATTLSALGGCATSPLFSPLYSPWGTAQVVVRAPSATQPDRQSALDAYWRGRRDAQQHARAYEALHPAPPTPATDATTQFEDGMSLRDRQAAREAAEKRARVRAALGQ